MIIKTEITMNGFEFMGKFYDHYIEEKDWAEDFINIHTKFLLTRFKTYFTYRFSP